ncbi:hypothetical protein EGJ27_23085 [Pseudomonas sp. v388]|uniref:hypothetical protein n=1 Tax=Pseudomonas sp. v388 TaxID=2479849 RepID=UPI000F7B0F74|nr:hypothetical protein [Pseudomonas sp. v388]RRV04239.1 hypothetical protein EGJ27_23085 [Pseudomonas sp. v388]
MPQEKIDQLKLPKPVRSAIGDFLRALNAASTVEDVKNEGELQIAFILSLEKAKTLKPPHIEALYIIFDDAVQEKLRQLAD